MESGRHTLFISDLHLHPQRPRIQTLFADFLSTAATTADGLYILGDLFEYWLGDDDLGPPYDAVLRQLRRLAATVPVYFMAGNRDFLAADGFSRRSGCALLPDPQKITLYGRDILLSHGDSLCLDDVEYQAFRKKTRAAAWIKRVMAMPLAVRRDYFNSLRESSKDSKSAKPGNIMDVNQAEVERVMTRFDVELLIHGHTHRPAVHRFTAAGRARERVVLGDWYAGGSVLYYFADGRYELRALTAA